jgi:hypothetical protein
MRITLGIIQGIKLNILRGNNGGSLSLMGANDSKSNLKLKRTEYTRNTQNAAELDLSLIVSPFIHACFVNVEFSNTRG